MGLRIATKNTELEEWRRLLRAQCGNVFERQALAELLSMRSLLCDGVEIQIQQVLEQAHKLLDDWLQGTEVNGRVEHAQLNVGRHSARTIVLRSLPQSLDARAVLRSLDSDSGSLRV